MERLHPLGTFKDTGLCPARRGRYRGLQACRPGGPGMRCGSARTRGRGLRLPAPFGRHSPSGGTRRVTAHGRTDRELLVPRRAGCPGDVGMNVFEPGGGFPGPPSLCHRQIRRPISSLEMTRPSRASARPRSTMPAKANSRRISSYVASSGWRSITSFICSLSVMGVHLLRGPRQSAFRPVIDPTEVCRAGDAASSGVAERAANGKGHKGQMTKDQGQNHGEIPRLARLRRVNFVRSE